MGIVEEFFGSFQRFIDNNTAEAFHHVIQYFDTPFFHLIGYTTVAAFASASLGFFFPQLKAFAGAVFFSLGTLWYGFSQGRK